MEQLKPNRAILLPVIGRSGPKDEVLKQVGIDAATIIGMVKELIKFQLASLAR